MGQINRRGQFGMDCSDVSSVSTLSKQNEKNLWNISHEHSTDTQNVSIPSSPRRFLHMDTNASSFIETETTLLHV